MKLVYKIQKNRQCSAPLYCSSFASPLLPRKRNDIFSFIAAVVNVVVNNIKVFSVITEMTQCVPFALLLVLIGIQCYESGPS